MLNAVGWRWLGRLAFVAALALLVWVAYGFAERVSIRALREANTHRIDIYSANLQAEMNRFEYLPPVVALNEHVAALLEHPENRALQATVNQHLQTVNKLAGASAIYVMDRKGLTLAASNWDQAGSFINMNFAYRPYFQDALKGVPSRFYGVGTVSREAGYYFGRAVTKNGVVLGVTAVKVNLEKLDQAWDHEGEKIVVADGNGVIFLSSEPAWKYRTLRKLSIETMGQLAATRQYTEAGLLSPLGLQETRVLDDGTAIVRVAAEPGEHQSAGAAFDYMVHGNRVPGTDWRLLVMSELSPARAAARYSAALAALTLVLMTMLVLFFQQRRRIVEQTIAARDELERKVEQRTEALSEVNRQLQDEIGERQRAEEALRATLEDRVHTAKMVVLGKMSAGITHELNQPLAALRTLSANTIVFLDRGQRDQAESNLRMIAQLTDHMGKITAQLKTYARKLAADLRPVTVASVLADTLFLLSQSMRIQDVKVELRIEPPELQALCDASRLQQVLLNLLSNAVDAVAGAAEPHIRVQVHGNEQWVNIEVHDNGTGVTDDAAPHLFEPFFSTKQQGTGLGLGLAISADIVRSLGGSVRAGSSEVLGGAKFTLQLKALVPEPAHA